MKRNITRIEDLPTSAVRWIGKEVERVEDIALVTPPPVSPLGVVAREVPASPQRLWRLLREAREHESGK